MTKSNIVIEIIGLLDHVASSILSSKISTFTDPSTLQAQKLRDEADDKIPVHRVLEPTAVRSRKPFQNRNIRIAGDGKSQKLCLWEAQQDGGSSTPGRDMGENSR